MNVITIIAVTLLIILVLVFARKVEETVLPVGLIAMNLFLLVYHTYVLGTLPSTSEYAISQIYLCLAMDFLWLLISFLGFLWIDDIRAVKFNKKSYDNSMRWFWDKL